MWSAQPGDLLALLVKFESVRLKRDALESVTNTLKDKGKEFAKGGQFDPAHVNLLAVDVGFSSGELVRSCVPGITRKLRDHSSVSAVVVYWTEITRWHHPGEDGRRSAHPPQSSREGPYARLFRPAGRHHVLADALAVREQAESPTVPHNHSSSGEP